MAVWSYSSHSHSIVSLSPWKDNVRRHSKWNPLWIDLITVWFGWLHLLESRASKKHPKCRRPKYFYSPERRVSVRPAHRIIWFWFCFVGHSAMCAIVPNNHSFSIHLCGTKRMYAAVKSIKKRREKYTLFTYRLHLKEYIFGIIPFMVARHG